jgi:Recombination endonuclease VII
METGFSKMKKHYDGHNSICKKCTGLYHVKKKYGLDPLQFEELRAGNNGVCEIAGNFPATEVDHCHTTNIVRGYLCNQCNMALHSTHTSVLHQGRADYLRRFEK